MQVVEVLAGLLLGVSGRLELHSGQLVEQARLGRLDVAHGDLLVLNDANAVVEELDDGLHHAHGLVHRTVVVVLRERVLLKELILYDLSSL